MYAIEYLEHQLDDDAHGEVDRRVQPRRNE